MIVGAILDVVDHGIKRLALFKDFPPMATVYQRFAVWEVGATQPVPRRATRPGPMNRRHDRPNLPPSLDQLSRPTRRVRVIVKALPNRFPQRCLDTQEGACMNSAVIGRRR